MTDFSSSTSSSTNNNPNTTNTTGTDAGLGAFARSKKVSSELVGFTYGALVQQFLIDFEDIDKVNGKLEEIGVNIGTRLVDDVLSKVGVRRCLGFRDAMNTVVTAFKMYMGSAPKVINWNEDATKCVLQFPTETALEEYVILGPQHAGLHYCNVLCGVIRGALTTVNIKVTCSIQKDRLKGDDTTEILIELIEILKETAGADYQE
jgi:hypothetical protein